MAGLGGLWLKAWTHTVTESAVSQRPALGPVLFNVFINDPQRIDGTCSHQVCRCWVEGPDDRLNGTLIWKW